MQPIHLQQISAEKIGDTYVGDGRTGMTESHRDGPPAEKPWVALSFDFVVPLIYGGTAVCLAKIWD